MFKEISVILPAFNEEDNIKKAVTDINAFLKKKFKKYEIIVVNNGSSDKTETIVKKLISSNRHIRILHLKKNNGYGAGLRHGFIHAKYELVFYTDADNQFNIVELDHLLPFMKKYDIACGYRKNRQDPMMRIIIAKIYNLIIFLLFQLKIRDIDCSFKIYKKSVFDKLKLKSNTGLIDAEILIKAKKAGFIIAPQIPVTHYPRTEGKTTYEFGPRGKVFALVKPKVITDIFSEIKTLWHELR